MKVRVPEQCNVAPCARVEDRTEQRVTKDKRTRSTLLKRSVRYRLTPDSR